MKSFVELLQAYFAEAAQEQGLVHRSFRIGGSCIRLQFAGGRWSNELTRAFAHLDAPPGSDSRETLRVAVWDGRTPPRNHVLRAYLFTLTNWWFDYTGRRGELLDIHDGSVSATYHPDTTTLSVIDHDRAVAFYWKRDTSPIPYYETCAPFRSVLHSWMRKNGAQLVHGAAVGTASGGALLAGKGGSGKSTSALACLGSSLQFAGDDYCIVMEDERRGYAINSLYCTAKVVATSDLDRFPALAANVVNPQRTAGEKLAISLEQERAGNLIERFPLRAILAPFITGAVDTDVVPCSVGEALMALAPSTLSQLPVSGREDLRFLGNMARRVPCYQLRLGSDIRQVPVKILHLLQTLGVHDAVSEEALVRVNSAT